MNENLVAYHLNVYDPAETTVGTSAIMVMVPFEAVLVYASASPHEDDAGATVDIQDDGTDIVTAIACATQATPGEWASTHLGGTNDPVAIAAGSEIELDFNNAAGTSRFDVTLLFLATGVWG